MSRNRVIIAIVAIVAIAGAIWVLAGGGTAGPAASGSPTLPPVAESNVVAADVRAVPIRHAELAAPGGGGVVAEVSVEEGDHVTAGQALVRLDGTRLQASVAQAQSAVAAADAAVVQAGAAARQAAAQVTVAEAGVDQAEAAVRAADATRDGTPSGGTVRRAANAEVDRAQAALRSARAQVAAARRAEDAAGAASGAASAETERTKAALVEAQAALDDLTLEAPFAGIVASLDAVVGETVTSATPVVRIADTSAWRFESIDLDEAAIGRLVEGATATVTVDAFPDLETPATVVSISPFGESSAGDIVYTILLEPTGDVPDGLRWNMTASAQIEAGP